MSGPPSGRPSRLAVAVEQATSGAVEALHLHQHPEEAGVGGVGRLGEDPAEALGARVLEPAAVAAHRHAHVGRLGVDAELAEQAQQRGVRAQVVHDEPAVDGHDAAVGGHDVVGVRVATEARLGLVERHVALALQHVRGGESGDTRADDGDATRPAVDGHDATSPVTSRHPAARASSSGRSNGASSAMAAVNAAVSRCQVDARDNMP